MRAPQQNFEEKPRGMAAIAHQKNDKKNVTAAASRRGGNLLFHARACLPLEPQHIVDRLQPLLRLFDGLSIHLHFELAVCRRDGVTLHREQQARVAV